MADKDPTSENTARENKNNSTRLYMKAVGTSSPAKMNREFFENKMLIIQAIRRGMPYKLFSKIKVLMPFSEDDWAEYLNISKENFYEIKNRPDYIFEPVYTEKIIQLAEVINYGKEIFNSHNKFYEWLKTPSYALGNFKPAELLKDSYGKELVMGELQIINLGNLAK